MNDNKYKFPTVPTPLGQVEVDAAIASLLDRGCEVKAMVDQDGQEQASDVQEAEVDTAAVAERVRYYLKFNQIQWTRFASLVLGVSQGRLSTLLGKPKPWQQLAPRVQALYQRMQLWMDTKATFGNNPYLKVKKEKPVVNRKRKTPSIKREKRRRSLFEASGSSALVPFEVEVDQGVVEEQGVVDEELNHMEQQVVVEEQVIHEVVVEEPAEQVVIENTSLGEVMLGNLVDLDLKEACLQVGSNSKPCVDIHQPPLEIRGPTGWTLSTFAHGQTFSLMVADVDTEQPDTYSLSLI